MYLLHRHATTLNLGDEALVAAVRRLLPPTATCCSIVNEPGEVAHGGRWIPESFASREQFAVLLCELRRCDALLVGGGDLILAFPSHYLAMRAARRMGVPIFHIGIGVNLRGSGRLADRWRRSELPQGAYYWARDGRSHEELGRWGVPADRRVQVPDLVFSLETKRLADEAEATRLPALPSSFIAVSVRSPEGNSGRWGAAQYRELAVALDEVVDLTQAEIVFVPFLSEARDRSRRYSRPGRNDTQVAHQVIGVMRQKAHAHVLGEVDYRQMLAVLRRARLTIGTRLHSLIFSTAVATPIVALSYNLKTEAYMRELGMEGLSVPMDQLRAEELVARVQAALANHEKLSRRLRDATAQRHDACSAYQRLTGLLRPRRKSRAGLSSLLCWFDWALLRLRRGSMT